MRNEEFRSRDHHPLLWFYAIAALVISSDLFLVFDVDGFKARAPQLLLMIPILAAVATLLVPKDIAFRWPLGFGSLVIWSSFVLLFTPNTSFLSRSFGYTGWLLFSVALVWATTQHIDSSRKLQFLLKWYLYSFGISAAFGLFQFACPFFGVKPPLIQQWWINGVLARINGFTYEPSYFATYMLTGWILIDYLRFNESTVMTKSRLTAIFSIVTLTLLLCSSRLGWTMMAAWWLVRSWMQRSNGVFTLKWWTRTAACLTCFLAVLAGAFIHFNLESGDLLFLTAGLGVVENMGEYSSAERLGNTEDTLTVFKNSPFIGVSLGGVAPAIGRMRGETVVDQDAAKENEGLCITAEALAAGGVFAFPAFLAYFGSLMILPFRTKYRSGQGAIIVRGIAWSLMFLLVSLQFNQNILRQYLWFHIALLSAAFALFRKPETGGGLALPV